jgi:hypothetical protein
MGPSLRALAFSTALVSLLAAPRAHALEHPPVLDPETGCERWLGGASGNDPSLRLNLRLCGEGSGVHGEVQWSSQTSGWNVREVRGEWSGDALTLRDVRIVEERPEPGWRFCTIDRWSLRRRGDRLEGTYDSAACSDHANVWLDRMADEARRPEGAGPPPPPSEASSMETPAPSPSPSVPPPGEAPPAGAEHASEQSAAGCGTGCAAGGRPAARGPLAALTVGLLGVCAARTRRPRSEARRRVAARVAAELGRQARPRRGHPDRDA